MVVGAGGYQYDGGKGSGVSGNGGGRGWGGGVTEGAKSMIPGTEHQKKIQVAKLTN